MKYIAYVGINDLKYLCSANVNHIDVFNIAFGGIEHGEVVIPQAEKLRLLSSIREKNPNCKFVLSVGGWSADGFSQSTRTDEQRKKLAASMLSAVHTYGLDGVDLDWEYPCFSVAGIESHPDDGENYVHLLREIRELFIAETEHKLLTIAVGGDVYYSQAVPMAKLEPYLDYVQIMSYDLRGGFTNVSGHHANLYQPKHDLTLVSGDKGVREYEKAGIPKEKLVLGVASYSRQWSGVPNVDQGYGQMAKTFGGYGPTYEHLKEHVIHKNGFVRYWDNVAKAPYLFDGYTFISYDDPESVEYKLDYAEEHNLYGIMIWEVSDTPDGELLAVMRKRKDRK